MAVVDGEDRFVWLLEYDGDDYQAANDAYYASPERRALDPDWQELGAFVTSSLVELFQTNDHREGVAAFMEKREPRFSDQ